MSEPILSGKLTKKFLMSLPEGSFLVSNVGHAPGQPLFAESVLPMKVRPEQWERIIRVRADQRLCRVYARAKDFLRQSLSVRYPRERN